MKDYEVLLTAGAEQSYLAVPDALLDRLDRALDVLQTAPELGTEYDPLYPAARPPFPVRVLYTRPFGIYYTVDRDAKKVFVRYIEDERMDPGRRFTGRLG